MGTHTEHRDNTIRAAIKTIEHEVLELERDLAMRLRIIQDTILSKRVRARSLENLLAPVNRLPNEIFLMCFRKAVQNWVDTNDAAEDWSVGFYETARDTDFILPCTPVLAISHVSHHWRQLAINTPFLWTNLVITQKCERHLDVFRDFLVRANGMPIAASFRSFGHATMLSSAGVLLMEAMMPMIRTQKISALSFLSLGPAFTYLVPRIVERTNSGLAPIVFDRLTTLSSFGLGYQYLYRDSTSFSHLLQLLSATPQLKTLKLQCDIDLDFEDAERRHSISLPMLENLTIIEPTPCVCKVLNSLFAPAVCQLKLQIDDESTDSSLRMPRFPRVQNLTIMWIVFYECLDVILLSAFPQVTHLTLGNQFYEMSYSLAPTTLQSLQHLTLNFAFDNSDLMDPQEGLSWLSKTKDRADCMLTVTVFDHSSEAGWTHAKKPLFQFYEELQRYGTLDRNSSRLDEFMRWQALTNGESEAAM
ncbi:hypothetical protein BJ138DRAFT_1163489 [Hygrophoropsis aurantiaca]|uniref:Uncharacterized protein n=1 Tax=Hygrophoropsis aurantiaca TaxID=72124 RepID=A0ACB7ZZH9_9AGAM|nr:hypothetical protein BJ138DRAFT_1163489 [Hygrophoropsis aurantiaca]